MFDFIPFAEPHLNIFRSWLQKNHIKPVWQESEDVDELKEKFLQKLPARGVKAFIFSQNTKLIGYIQYYSAPSIGGGWWEKELPGTYGIDLMIGDEKKMDMGIGHNVIKEFISFICKVESNVKSVIVDPEPSNVKAIRAFEKAGFIQEAKMETLNGTAILMRFKITSHHQ